MLCRSRLTKVGTPYPAVSVPTFDSRRRERYRHTDLVRAWFVDGEQRGTSARHASGVFDLDSSLVSADAYGSVFGKYLDAYSGPRLPARKRNVPVHLEVQRAMVAMIGDPLARAKALPKLQGHIEEVPCRQRSIGLADEQLEPSLLPAKRSEPDPVTDRIRMRAGDQKVGEDCGLEARQPVADKARIVGTTQF